MSLGSSSQWQAMLLKYVPFVDIGLPASVFVTAFVGIILFCQYDYTEGTVIPSLAIIEEPLDPPNARPLENAEFNASNALEKASIAKSNTPQQGQPPGLKKLARRMAPSVAGQLFAFVMPYLGSIADFSRASAESWFGIWFPASLATTLFLSVMDDGVLFECHRNAITKQRKCARRYLRGQYGRWSLYRGFSTFLAHVTLSTFFVLMTVPAVCWRSVSFPAYVLARLCLGLPLANLQMASLHTAISNPNEKTIWNRIPGWHAWVMIAPAVSLDIILPTSGYYLTVHLRELLRQTFPDAIGFRECPASSSLAETSVLMVLSAAPLFASFLLSVVTRAIYIRVAAALLPDDDEYVVPFDRTFGALESCRNSYLSVTLKAWQTITLEGFFRYLRAVTEVAFIEILCFSPFMTALFIQVGLSEPCIAKNYAILFARDVLRCTTN